MIIFIAAYQKNRGIGFRGQVPWPRMAADRERLHKLTKDKTIVMGAGAYAEYQHVQQYFRPKKAIIVSRSLSDIEGFEIVKSLNEIIERAKTEDLWVIGGAQLYEQLLPYAQEMFLTEIDTSVPADTYFPSFDESDWQVIAREAHTADGQNPAAYTYTNLTRIK